jgi:chemotaxis protein CheZ
MHDMPNTSIGRIDDPIRDQLVHARELSSAVDRHTITEVVTAVLTTMSGDLSATETSLLSEVEALGKTIAAAKVEIAALKVDDIRDRDIPFATDELDAIVEHTAGATNAILESCEMLDEVAAVISAMPPRGCRTP